MYLSFEKYNRYQYHELKKATYQEVLKQVIQGGLVQAKNYLVELTSKVIRKQRSKAKEKIRYLEELKENFEDYYDGDYTKVEEEALNDLKEA